MGGQADYMRIRRIVTGEVNNVMVPAAVLGRLWQHGGGTTRTILADAIPADILDACYHVATVGATRVGSGKHLVIEGRNGRRRGAATQHVNPANIHASLPVAPSNAPSARPSTVTSANY